MHEVTNQKVSRFLVFFSSFYSLSFDLTKHILLRKYTNSWRWHEGCSKHIFQEEYIFAFEISHSLATPASETFKPSAVLHMLWCSLYQNSTQQGVQQGGKEKHKTWLFSYFCCYLELFLVEGIIVLTVVQGWGKHMFCMFNYEMTPKIIRFIVITIKAFLHKLKNKELATSFPGCSVIRFWGHQTEHALSLCPSQIVLSSGRGTLSSSPWGQRKGLLCHSEYLIYLLVSAVIQASLLSLQMTRFILF